MRRLKDRLIELEKTAVGAEITDVTRASDAQLEAYLLASGIDPRDEEALLAAARVPSPAHCRPYGQTVASGHI